MSLQPGRWTAELEGDFVVFLIGAMVHDPAVTAEVSGLLMAMGGHARRAGRRPVDRSAGLHPTRGTGQGRPRSVLAAVRGALEAYARDPGALQAPVWRAWNRLGSDDRGAAGIWHETFKVNGGNYEAIYQNTPAMGLQKAGRPVTVTEAKDSARPRLSR